jgi:hypothetical protein
LNIAYSLFERVEAFVNGRFYPLDDALRHSGDGVQVIRVAFKQAETVTLERNKLQHLLDHGIGQRIYLGHQQLFSVHVFPAFPRFLSRVSFKKNYSIERADGGRTKSPNYYKELGIMKKHVTICVAAAVLFLALLLGVFFAPAFAAAKPDKDLSKLIVEKVHQRGTSAELRSQFPYEMEVSLEFTADGTIIRIGFETYVEGKYTIDENGVITADFPE